MRIGIDCRIFGPNFTGIGRYTYELCTRFIAFNKKLPHPHKIFLFFNNPEFKNFQTKDSKNVEKVLVDVRHYSFAEQFIFPKILKKYKLDIVHFPHFNVPILYRKPYVTTIHDLILSFFPGQKMTGPFRRLAYHLTIKNAVKTSRKIITVSENTKNDLINYLKIPSKKIKVIYNGISDGFTFFDDPKIAEKTLKKYKIASPFLLYTGVHRSHKNLVNLVKAFRILLDKWPQNAKVRKDPGIKLVITGKEDPHYPEIIKAVKKLHLEKNIILTGMVNETELNHLYNAALIFVFPSLYEGFGLPPLEAMKCGTPVAASNRSSIPEVVGQENAVYFNPEDPQDIAEKIETLYKDVDLQARLVANGIARAKEFDWNKTAKETWETLLKYI